jgi:SAM-dependent methyltransferase
MGCGKGRVLLIGAEFGFEEARGVEFARELCEVARKNIAHFSQKRLTTKFTIIEADAATYEVSPEENIFIMCNPFDGVIVNAVLDNIVRSLRTSRRRVLVIYCNPTAQAVLEARQDFVKIAQVPFPGYNFAIFSNCSD